MQTQPNSDLDNDFPEEIEPNILMLVELVKTTLFQFIKKLDILMNQKFKETGKIEGFKKMKMDPEMYKVRHCVSNKIEVLWKILAESKTLNDDTSENQFCGIIFCQTRITALVLRWYLEEAAKRELNFIKPEVLLGQSTIVGDVNRRLVILDLVNLDLVIQQKGRMRF